MEKRIITKKKHFNILIYNRNTPLSLSAAPEPHPRRGRQKLADPAQKHPGHETGEQTRRARPEPAQTQQRQKRNKSSVKIITIMWHSRLILHVRLMKLA